MIDVTIEDAKAFARMDEFSAWVKENIHVGDFSPRFQQIIREYQAEVARQYLERETDLEYLRRVRPQWSDDKRLSMIFLCATHTQTVRETIPESEAIS